MTSNKYIISFVFVMTALKTSLAMASSIGFIIGGNPSSSKEWPSMVVLVENGYDNFEGHFCAGSLISSTWVVTAAHCVKEFSVADFHIVANVSNLTQDPGKFVNIKRIVIHPKFNSDTMDNDIALLQLKKPVLGTRTLPLMVGTSSLVSVNAVAIGWGVSGDDGTYWEFPEQLQATKLPIVSNRECQDNIGESSSMTNNMLCAGFIDGSRAACYGDSGGPLIIKQNKQWRLAGIISRGIGYGDGCDTYGVYTRVSKYIGFIKNTLKIK